MYLFKTKDGAIGPAPEDFDPKNPDWSHLQEVQEVLVINKVLVPEIKLVPKTIRSEKDAPEPRSSPKSKSSRESR